MDKKKEFLRIFKLAEKKYGKSDYRLAGEAWPEDYQTLITTIMSAQSRDETTIPIAEALFDKYDTLDKLANAKFSDVLKILKSMNYNRTKSKNVIGAAKGMVNEFSGRVPDEIDELVKLPGVGRKTANLVLSEIHKKDSICVDTHVHRISNVFNFVDTKNANETEMALRELVPKKYWSKINRIFVLWGRMFQARIRKDF
jgi:endonuclease-3